MFRSRNSAAGQIGSSQGLLTVMRRCVGGGPAQNPFNLDPNTSIRILMYISICLHILVLDT